MNGPELAGPWCATRLGRQQFSGVLLDFECKYPFGQKLSLRSYGRAVSISSVEKRCIFSRRWSSFLLFLQARELNLLGGGFFLGRFREGAGEDLGFVIAQDDKMVRLVFHTGVIV